jgi:hypothetical protein
MNHVGFRNALSQLGMSQLGCARLFRVSGRSVRRWVAGHQPVPWCVELCLRLQLLLLQHNIKLEVPPPGVDQGPKRRPRAKGETTNEKGPS